MTPYYFLYHYIHSALSLSCSKKFYYIYPKEYSLPPLFTFGKLLVSFTNSAMLLPVLSFFIKLYGLPSHLSRWLSILTIKIIHIKVQAVFSYLFHLFFCPVYFVSFEQQLLASVIASFSLDDICPFVAGYEDTLI